MQGSEDDQELLTIPANGGHLEGDLVIPRHPSGVVLFAHEAAAVDWARATGTWQRGIDRGGRASRSVPSNSIPRRST